MNLRFCLALMLAVCIATAVPRNGHSQEAGDMRNSVGMRFVYIRPGTFEMGSPETEAGRERNETLHTVTLSNGFYMAVTEVTQRQWFDVVGYNPATFRECGGNCPVDNVSWDDCQEFITALNKREGTTQYRLPTEAEWEYACRAGSKAATYNGNPKEKDCTEDPVLARIAWYCGNTGKINPYHDFKPMPAGKLRPNAWGLYDMLGNVHEWVLDRCEWRDGLSGHVGVITDTYQKRITDPYSAKGSRRIFRGGSWHMAARHIRAAKRSYYRPNARKNDIGFRVVRTPYHPE